MLKQKSIKMIKQIIVFFTVSSLLISPYFTNSQIIKSKIILKNHELSRNSSTVNLENYLLGKLTVWSEFYLIDTPSIIIDNDGNSYVTGTLQTDLFTLTTDIILGKIANNGTLLWIKQWDYQDVDIANDILFDEDNNQLIVLGETNNDTDSLFSDLLVVSFNTNTGQVLWNKTYGDAILSEQANSAIIHTTNLYIAGMRTDFFHVYSNSDIFLMCINKNNGSLLWEKTYQTSFSDRSPSIIYDNLYNNLYLVSNRYNILDDVIYYQYNLRKITTNGTITWEKNTNNETSTRISDLKISYKTNSLILLGDKFEDNNVMYRDCTVIFYNFSGHITNQVTFGKEELIETAKAFCLTANDSLHIVGIGEIETTKNDAAFRALMKINGEVIYFEKSGNFEFSSFNDIAVTDECFLVSVGTCKYNIDIVITRLLISFARDLDEDILCELWETKIGTDPSNPDTDNDTFLDGEEYLANTDPLNARSNPKSREFWRNFGINFSITIIVITIILQIILFFTQRSKYSPEQELDNQTFIIRLFDKIFKRNKRRKE